MKQTPPEILFRDNLIHLIENLLIDNPNYKGYYYKEPNNHPSKVIEDTQERARYILEKIHDWEHLIGIEELTDNV